MNLQKVAEQTLTAARSKQPLLEPVRSEAGTGSAHAAWMLHGISMGYLHGDKAMRWLGYAQGVLVELEILSLPYVKKINAGAIEE